MKVIGLTGPSGAGKGAVGSCFEKRGIPVIDCDKEYHTLLLPPSACTDEIVSVFGERFRSPDGSLDRAALSREVFRDKKKLETLNRISHKYVIERIEALLLPLGERKEKAAVIDAPTLFESGADKLCDAVVAVTADPETRVGRITERDGIPREAALSRIEAQPEDAFYTSRADFVIRNGSGTGMEELAAGVDGILRALGVAP